MVPRTYIRIDMPLSGCKINDEDCDNSISFENVLQQPLSCCSEALFVFFCNALTEATAAVDKRLRLVHKPGTLGEGKESDEPGLDTIAI
jgi:hypothetical protein